jgi:hypothetical protein
VKYSIRKAALPFKLDGCWDKRFWEGADTLILANFMGERPVHFPKIQARLLYDETCLYIIFHVEDRYIRAMSKKFGDAVCCDSCAEFFFTPGIDIEFGYFNIEMNCSGVMLMNHQRRRDENCRCVSLEDAGKIQIFHSLPKTIEPEITEPTTWTLEYRLPIEILRSYTVVERPDSGVVWRANFYKCGDETSHPHWLTWAPIDLPKPDFHQPSFFGTLEFE